MPGDFYSVVEEKQLKRFHTEDSIFKFLRRSTCGGDLSCDTAFPPLVLSGAVAI